VRHKKQNTVEAGSVQAYTELKEDCVEGLRVLMMDLEMGPTSGRRRRL
jgi:hypothetical protein